MKKLFALALCLLLCMALCACEKEKPLPACADVAAAVQAAQTMPELVELSEKQIEKYFLLGAEQYAEASARIDASRVTAECVCVFTAKDKEGLAQLEAALSAYRDDMLSQYRDYRPEEAPKLENAVLKTNGLQTALIVSADAQAAQSALSECWK